MQSHVTLHLNRANHEGACGHKHHSTLVIGARIEGRLNRRCIERDPIAFRTEIANVVGARTAIVTSATGTRSGLSNQARDTHQT